LGLVGGYDVVVDGSDNFPTRYLVNDACVLAGKPDVFGSVLRFEGQVSVFAAAGGPCYRCLFPEPPPAGLVPSCAEGGVFGVLPGVIGSLQAHETIKLLLDLGQPLIGRFLVFDGIQLRFREITLSRDPHCPICSDNATKTTLVASGGGCELPSRVEDEEMAVPFDISPAEVQAWRDEGHEFRILDVRTPAEYAIARIDDATLVPLDQLSTRLDELDREEEIVVLCHHGIRSAHAVAFLRRQGLVRVRNLSGGIAAWSRDVDDSVPQY
jgi:adenylyltransferase/sulfurtransferase